MKRQGRLNGDTLLWTSLSWKILSNFYYLKDSKLVMETLLKLINKKCFPVNTITMEETLNGSRLNVAFFFIFCKILISAKTWNATCNLWITHYASNPNELQEEKILKQSISHWLIKVSAIWQEIFVTAFPKHPLCLHYCISVFKWFFP